MRRAATGFPPPRRSRSSASGALTAEALIRACLDRAEERQSVKAWTWLDPEQALAQAREADRAGRPGLLAGLPIGVKDIIDTVDMPTEHGSPIYRGNRPFADAACVALLRMAGGTIMGKTVTTEFANRFPGATVNPHNPAHTPGRLVERLGRGGRRFPGAGGARHPDRRLGDPPVGVLRRHRLQAELRRIQPQRHQTAMPQSRHARHHLPHASRTCRRCAPRSSPRRAATSTATSRRRASASAAPRPGTAPTRRPRR